ncbi:glyoxalase [Nonomuraea mesophila]|uniref:Glyoxalase n=1 Tax=Nonomuraea mesophila TaxID=2530382 RepID=A0A4R5EHP4_9ACTN|nr:VOC family protein [Nonomuraea mesophila]TDE34009.1 glyoxalase [Nonomuraea mesophila]
MLHHVELWVPDLPRATESWQWLLAALGYTPYQEWSDGRSWRSGRTYVVLEQSPALTADRHDRCRPGLNHLAFHVDGRARLDELVGEAAAYGWTLLFPDRHPHAGGDEHYAAYLEDRDGFEVELVASTPQDLPPAT